MFVKSTKTKLYLPIYFDRAGTTRKVPAKILPLIRLRDVPAPHGGVLWKSHAAIQGQKRISGSTRELLKTAVRTLRRD